MRRRAAVCASTLALIGAGITPARARATCAQSEGPARLSSCIDSDTLWPHAGSSPFFALGSPVTTPEGSLALGLVTSFFTESVGARIASASLSGSQVFLVDDALDATLLVAWGLTRRLELTLALPMTLYQSGAGLAAIAAGGGQLPATALRDLRFGFTIGILERAAGAPGAALAFRLETAAPTATAGAFAGGSTAVAAPSLAFAYRMGRVDLSAELTARIRGEDQLANAVIGTEIGGAIGASVDVLPSRWLELGAEAFALVSTARQGTDPFGTTPPGATQVPSEWIAHASTARLAGGDLLFDLGGGTTLPLTPHGAFTSPRYRLDFAVRYTPSARGASTRR